MFYGKNDDEPTPMERLERRVRELERVKEQQEKDDNFSLTGHYAGGDRDDD